MENEMVVQQENHSSSPIMTVGDWMITILLLIIPLVNLIMLFIWAFGGDTNPTKANFAKAYLIWLLIGIVFYIFIILVFGAALIMSDF